MEDWDEEDPDGAIPEDSSSTAGMIWREAAAHTAPIAQKTRRIRESRMDMGLCILFNQSFSYRFYKY